MILSVIYATVSTDVHKVIGDNHRRNSTLRLYFPRALEPMFGETRSNGYLGRPDRP